MEHLTLLYLAAALALQSVHAADAPIGPAEDRKPRAELTIDTEAPTLAYSPMIFGGFLEHFDRQIYGGIFDPGSPLADNRGIRRDVVDALRELGTPIVRWPGGCFVSGYHWELGVGKEQWAPFVRDAAKAMKAADPSLKLSAAAQATRQWTLPLLKEAGQYLDYISIHSYWLPLWEKNERPDYLTCILKAEEPEKALTDFVRILDESGYRGKIKIAYDEWNLRSWHHPKFPRLTVQDYEDPEVKRLVKEREKNEIASQYTMADALFTASFFNACLRHADDVGMANIAPLVNTRGPLHVHPKGILKRTHFYTMRMYANELEARVGKLKLAADPLTHRDRSVPVADAIATVDQSGKQWAIALVNRHPEKSLACTVRFKDRALDGTFGSVVLAGDSPEAFNDVDRPYRVVPEHKRLRFSAGIVELPPHSLTIVKVPASAGK